MSEQPVWLIGDWQHDDFSSALKWLSANADCRRFDASAAALTATPTPSAPTAIVFAQSRPGEFAAGEMEQLRTAVPHSRLYILTGPWCEGELRSGRPLVGITRIPWRRWQAGLECHFSLPSREGGQPLADRVRVTEIERIESSTRRLRRDKFAPASAVVFTSRRSTNESLHDALVQLNVSARWHSSGPDLPPPEADLTFYDGWEHVPPTGDAEPIASKRWRLLLLHFPRPDDAEAAETVGIAAIIAMPFLLADLATTINRLASATSPNFFFWIQRSLAMNRLQLPILVLFIAAVIMAWSQATSQSPQAGKTLPGARPAIEAANYPSLQAAIDALPPTGGLLRLPAGTFEINEPLRISQEDVLIEGSGTATHIKNVNTAGQPAIEIDNPKRKTEPRSTLWRVSLQNMRVTGNEKSGHGILAHHVDEIFLEGVTVSYHGGNGVHLDHCYEDPRICDCLLTYNKAAGLHLDVCHDIVVVGNQFEENLDAIVCKDGFNLCMTGNNLDDHLRHGVVIENTYGSVVSGNMIEECKGIAIILDRDCYGITLSSNVIAHEVEGGIDLRDAHGCAVSGNTFTIVKKDALRIGKASSRITVSGNNFSNSFIGSGQKRQTTDQTASGIVLSGTSDVAITGNSFAGLTTKAVALEGEPSQRVLFSNNLLTEVESDVAQASR